MSCTEWSCGTGDWTGPKPGDPENVLSLRAVGTTGGVELSWTYPTINPAAVAHFKIFRGISGYFENAVELVITSGSYHLDKIPNDEIREYYYWLQMVTVNGTVMDVVGPSIGTPINSLQDFLESLTGVIDSGFLANSLRQRIDMIDAVKTDIAQETLNRIHTNQSLADALASVQSTADEAHTYIYNETTQRQDADAAIVKSVEALAVGLNENAAALVRESETRVTAETAITNDIEILYSDVADNAAAIVTEQETRSTALEATAKQIEALVTTTGKNSSAIETEKQARSDADSSLASSIETWSAKTSSIAAGLEEETTARISANEALASQITTAQSVLDGNIASVQTNLTTDISAVKGKVDSIGALYTAKVDVNGLVGGFGVYNDGKTVEAGFDVDRFWIGRTNNSVKPFIYNGSTTYLPDGSVIPPGIYMDQAFVRKLRGTYIEAGMLKAAKMYTGSQLVDSSSNLDIPAVASGSWMPGSVYAVNPVTSAGLRFYSNGYHASAPYNQRIKDSSTSPSYLLVTACATADHFFSLWYRVNGGGWQCLNTVVEPQDSYGATSITYGMPIYFSGDVYFDIGVSSSNSAQYCLNTAKGYLQYMTVTAMVINL